MFRESDFHPTGNSPFSWEEEGREGFYPKSHSSGMTPGTAEENEDGPQRQEFSFADIMRPTSFPQIETVFDYSADHPNNELYNQAVSNILRKIMPPESFLSENSLEEQLAAIDALKISLPLFKWIVWDSSTLNISIFLLCPFRLNAGKFFYDMISRWLLPGKRINISLFFATDFRMPQLDRQIYTLGEIVVHLDQPEDFEQALRNLPILATEIRLGVGSVFHAAKILEIKGLTTDEKTAMIQEKIVALLHDQPEEFDSDIFTPMQHFLVACRPEFKAEREVRQMSRLICYFYLMRRDLRQKVELLPTKRHLRLKIGRTRLHLPLGMKRVLGIFVALNFLKENEIFEERHLIAALVDCVPSIGMVPGSLFIEQRKDDRIQVLYLEVEKCDGSNLTSEEIRRLRTELPDGLKGRVQQLTRPVFMPRNEEEVMRNVVTLSQELRYLRDIPQVIISFDEHTDTEVSFTIVMVRILLPRARSIQEILPPKGAAHYTFILDRVKHVGAVWKKYPKEASVFRIRLPVGIFVRSDHSLDLLKARQAVLAEIQREMGEVRDYNGGMISQQVGVFRAVYERLGPIAQQHELLFENFFHSILPVEMRSMIAPDHVHKLFLLFLALLNRKNDLSQKMHVFFEEEESQNAFYLMVGLNDQAIKSRLFDAIESLRIPYIELPSVVVQVVDIMYVGYICLLPSSQQRKQLRCAVAEALKMPI